MTGYQRDSTLTKKPSPYGCHGTPTPIGRQPNPSRQQPRIDTFFLPLPRLPPPPFLISPLNPNTPPFLPPVPTLQPSASQAPPILNPPAYFVTTHLQTHPPNTPLRSSTSTVPSASDLVDPPPDHATVLPSPPLPTLTQPPAIDFITRY
jgi:hypothetical protein